MTTQAPNLSSLIQSQSGDVLAAAAKKSDTQDVVDALSVAVNVGAHDAISVLVKALPDCHKTVALKSPINKMLNPLKDKKDDTPSPRDDSSFISSFVMPINKILFAASQKDWEITTLLLSMLDQDTHRTGIDRVICEMVLQHQHDRLPDLMKHVDHSERLNWERLVSACAGSGSVEGLRILLSYVSPSNRVVADNAAFWCAHNGKLDCLNEVLAHFEWEEHLPSNIAMLAAVNGHADVLSVVIDRCKWSAYNIERALESVLSHGAKSDGFGLCQQLLHPLVTPEMSSKVFVQLVERNQVDGVRRFCSTFDPPAQIHTLLSTPIQRAQSKIVDQLLPLVAEQCSEEDRPKVANTLARSAVNSNQPQILSRIFQVLGMPLSKDLNNLLKRASKIEELNGDVIDIVSNHCSWEMMKTIPILDTTHPRFKAIVAMHQDRERLNQEVSQIDRPSGKGRKL